MRRFVGYRPEPPAEYLEKGTAAPPDQPQYEGVVFTDGSVALRWRTAYRSTSVWSSYADFEHVHGHPEYGTRIEWLDNTSGEVWRIRAEYAERRLQELNRAFDPLCPCDPNPETTDGPHQDCPLHGDGVSFVAQVRYDQDALRSLRARVTTGGPAPAFTEVWENGASSRPSTAPPEDEVVELPAGWTSGPCPLEDIAVAVPVSDEELMARTRKPGWVSDEEPPPA